MERLNFSQAQTPFSFTIDVQSNSTGKYSHLIGPGFGRLLESFLEPWKIGFPKLLSISLSLFFPPMWFPFPSSPSCLLCSSFSFQKHISKNLLGSGLWCGWRYQEERRRTDECDVWCWGHGGWMDGRWAKRWVTEGALWWSSLLWFSFVCPNFLFSAPLSLDYLWRKEDTISWPFWTFSWVTKSSSSAQL